MGLLDRLLGRRPRFHREAVDAALAQAREALRNEQPQRALESLRSAILLAPDDGQLLATMAAVAVQLGDSTSAEIFARAADAPDDPARLLELGAHLIGEDAPDLAEVFLARALRFQPFDAVLRSELALAQAALGKPSAAVETLSLHPNLAGDPGALFLLGWSLLLDGDERAAASVFASLEQQAATEPLTRVFREALARASIRPATLPPDARDFLYLEHGALLLHLARDHRGRYGEVRIDRPLVELVLGQLVAYVRAQFPEPPRIIAAHGKEQPMALALARALGSEAVDLGPGRAPAGIVVARTMTELMPIADRLGDPGSGVFSFALAFDWSRTAPFVPHFVGLLARQFAFDDGVLDAIELHPPFELSPRLRVFTQRRAAALAPERPRTPMRYLPDAPLPRA